MGSRDEDTSKRTISATLEDVRLHGLLAVLGTDVALGRDEHLDVLLGGLESGGKGGRGSHFVCLVCGATEGERQVSLREPQARSGR